MIHEFPPIHDCWYLTGATASGKTRIALPLAQALDAEIISLDSMAVYRGMDIGTAKPSSNERAQVPHHLLDVVDPNVEFSLADYLSLSHAAVDEIRSRNRPALFVGGTPLYLKALLRGVCEGPPGDPEFRREVESEIRQVGLEALRARLEQVDPLSAAKLHPHDKRRTIRALEVYKLTGVPISHYQTQFDNREIGRCPRVFALTWDRTELHDRIHRRVDSMFAQGLVDEVRALLAKHGSLSRTARQGVGYREILDWLAGRKDLAGTIEQTKVRTRRFARRQETWFRGLDEVRSIKVDEATKDQDIVAAIMEGSSASD